MLIFEIGHLCQLYKILQWIPFRLPSQVDDGVDSDSISDDLHASPTDAETAAVDHDFWPIRSVLQWKNIHSQISILRYCWSAANIQLKIEIFEHFAPFTLYWSRSLSRTFSGLLTMKSTFRMSFNLAFSKASSIDLHNYKYMILMKIIRYY